MKKIMLVLCVAITATLLISGCGGPESDAKDMLDAMVDGDIDSAMEYMDFEPLIAKVQEGMAGMTEEQKKQLGAMGDSEQMLQMIKGHSKSAFEKDKLISYEITETEEQEDGSVKLFVEAKLEGGKEQAHDIIMRNTDGRWKWDIMAMAKQSGAF